MEFIAFYSMAYKEELLRNITKGEGGEMGLGHFGESLFGMDNDVWSEETKSSQSYSEEALPTQ